MIKLLNDIETMAFDFVDKTILVGDIDNAIKEAIKLVKSENRDFNIELEDDYIDKEFESKTIMFNLHIDDNSFYIDLDFDYLPFGLNTIVITNWNLETEFLVHGLESKGGLR